MIYSAIRNYVMIQEWGLSANAADLLVPMLDMENWATKITSGGRDYYYLTITKILEDMPCLKSRSTVSRAIQELESKGIIEGVGKSSRKPAYRMTQKGLLYKSHRGREWPKDKTPNGGDDEPKPNGGEAAKETPKKKGFSFRLGRKAEYVYLGQEYREKLQKYAIDHMNKKNIPHEQYSKFVAHWRAQGAKFKDWSQAFVTWCLKFKEFERKNGGGQNDGQGNYYDGLMG